MSKWIDKLRHTLTTILVAGFFVLSLPFGLLAQDGDATGDEEQAAEENTRTAKTIYPLDPFNLPVFKRGKVEGYLLLVVKLELERTVPNAEIDRQMPLLRNKLNLAARRLASERVRVERPVNPGVAAWYMQRAANDVLGPGRVRVLIDEAIYRAL